MAPASIAPTVRIAGATGLHKMNDFTGDSLYCICEVVQAGVRSRFETKPTNSTFNPKWNEECSFESWNVGEALEFTVKDKGLLGARVEGKATLKSDQFYPNGFEGELPLEGCPDARLQICISFDKSALSPENLPSATVNLSMEFAASVRQDMQSRAAAATQAAAVVAQKIEDREAAEVAILHVHKEHAVNAALGIVAMLKDYYGEMEPRKLSQHVKDIIHDDDLGAKMDLSFRRALRTVVPEDRAVWLADDVEAHLQRLTAKLTTLGARAIAIAKDPKVQVTTAGAAAGAVTLGAVGGGVGCVGGGVVGAAVGLVPALFTFGLSIPAMAVVGGGVGLCVGAAAGGGTGIAAGGAAGYGAYAYSDEIKGAASSVGCKITDSTAVLREKAAGLTNSVRGVIRGA